MSISRSTSFPACRRGSVVVIVLWAIAVAAIVTSSVQLFSYRQATLGRDALERVQARWAARAGLENTFEVMNDHTLKPREDDALAMIRDMYYVSAGDTINASYTIMHHVDGRDFGGPMDEHSKFNLNREDDRALLLALDDMSLEVLDSVGDWLDQDNEMSALGVERDYYRSLEGPYEPRNGPLQSLAEIELIAGIWPKHFRGEDWNLNNRLDPNENDSARTFPPDTADGILDPGWSGYLTVYSVGDGATASGEPRIRLKDATVDDLVKRCGVEEAQADALIKFGETSSNTLSDLLFMPLGGGSSPDETGGGDARGGRQGQQQQQQGRQGEGQGGQNQGQGPNPLTEKQLRAVLAETCIADPLDRKPGKINLNTVSSRFFRDILEFINVDESIADEILYMRDSRPQGITSIVDLKKIPNITPQDLQSITRRFDTVSNVYTVSSRGRSWSSGLEVEIIAVVDRSTVPVQIIEYREQ